MTIYFSSDTHYNHAGIIHRQPRPFASLDEMNQTMIDRWNERVTDADTVYHLGDFAYTNKPGAWALADIYRRLKGRKILVRGNHDYQYDEVLDLPWDEQHELIQSIRLTSGKRPRYAMACHYALETWRGMAKGTLMLHGHSHGTLARTAAYRRDVGVDVWGFAPVSAEELLHDVRFDRFEPADYHGGPDYDRQLAYG